MAKAALDDITPELERLWNTDPLSPQVSVHSYLHSPVHTAILTKDHAALNAILRSLPKPALAGSVETEEQSVKAETEAEAASAVIDRRDVPGKESALHLAVRMKDPVALELLMLAGADISLQNVGGWTALQEAVCASEPALAAIIMREYQNLAWAKWLRRLPRLVATMKRMRDFYMELTWNFESSVIPFIGKIAPSDTYRIWKRGASLRADMTLEGFDGFRIKRADQSILFLGEGTLDGKVKPGGVVVLMHKEREVGDALEGMGGPVSDADLAGDVADLFKTNVHRAGLDVTKAELVPVKTWRRHEKEEMVGLWKSKVIDMHHVTVSFRSRKVPGAMSDEELFNLKPDEEDASSTRADDDYSDVLTEEERKQLKEAMEKASEGFSEDDHEHGVNGAAGEEADGSLTPEESEREPSVKDGAGVDVAGSLTPGGARGALTPGEVGGQRETRAAGAVSTSGYEQLPPEEEIRGGEKKPARKSWFGWGKKHQELSPDVDPDASERNGAESIQSPMHAKRAGKSRGIEGEEEKKESASEMEFSKGLKPTLWLTGDFPLKVEELLPLLDLLSPRVKAVRRLRELLTVKMPRGSFPVKVAIPIIPTIRVVVTVSKFQEIARQIPPGSEEDEDQFEDAQSDIPKRGWMDWVRGAPEGEFSGDESEPELGGEDAFAIPADYAWIDSEEKRRRDREKKHKRAKKGKGKASSSDRKS